MASFNRGRSALSNDKCEHPTCPAGLSEVIKRLERAREMGQEYHGEIIISVANNKMVSVHKRFEIKEDCKGEL